MKWQDYVKKQLDQIKINFYDVQLSLRFYKNSIAYKACVQLLDKLQSCSDNISHQEYYSVLCLTYVWCSIHSDSIPDISVFNKTILLRKKVNKQLKKMKQRLNLTV